MTHAQSIVSRIDMQCHQTRRLSAAAPAANNPPFNGEQWSPNEVLLHLIGTTGDLARGLDRALIEDAPTSVARQAGGQYLPHPDAASASRLLAVLIAQLEAIASVVRDLDDVALQRLVTFAAGAGAVRQVPVGLWLQNAIGGHFELHLTQLNEALVPPREE